MPPLRLAIKVIPGASRDEIAGRLGDRLKIRITAPPEGGKANRAICALVASELSLRDRDISIVAGHGSAEKTLEISGVTQERIDGLFLE